MLRLRPSDAPIEEESLTVMGPDGECQPATLVDDLVHTQLVDWVLIPAGRSTITCDAVVLSPTKYPSSKHALRADRRVRSVGYFFLP